MAIHVYAVLCTLVIAWSAQADADAPTYTYARCSDGPISFAAVHPLGTFIVLENNIVKSTGTVDMDHWKLKRMVEFVSGHSEYIYEFDDFELGPRASVTIYANGSADQAGPGDLVFTEEETWGTGPSITTLLLNDKNEKTAFHTQETASNTLL